MTARASLAALMALAALAAPAAGQPRRDPAPPAAPAARVREELIAAGMSAALERGFVEFAEDGTIAMLSAAPGRSLATSPIGTTASDRARGFVLERREAFGLGGNADLALTRSNTARGRTYHRFQERVGGWPVLAGDLVVQLDAASAVECVINKAARVSQLEGLSLPAAPALTRAAAEGIALDDLRARFPDAIAGARQSEPMLFVPELIGGSGRPALVWAVDLYSPSPEANERVLVDAADGRVLWRLALHAEALNRNIWDAGNGRDRPFTLVRSEGGAAGSVADANSTYDILSDTWNFYANQFGRDSYDGSGGMMRGVVRYCGFGPNLLGCANASFTATDTMYVGPGFAVDDVVAHEVTHGVTRYTSGLLYQNASGAINESMSDIFGEYVDLTNATGNDAWSQRWLVGEDLGTLRDMKTPGNFGDPDRLGSTSYVAAVATPNLGNDYGGVHTDSGVGNKLCYLLTDGDTFNGQVVDSMGINDVAALFYEANTNLLTGSSGWTDLYNALRQAAINLGWTEKEQNNVVRACRAVEIATPSYWYADWSSPCPQYGIAACAFPIAGPARSLGVAAGIARPGDVVVMTLGTYHEGLLTLTKMLTIESGGGPVTISP